MIENLTTLSNKIQNNGEKVVVANKFGVISSDDKGYKIYVGDRQGRINIKLTSKHYDEFAIFDNFILLNKKTDRNNNPNIHRAVFVNNINYDLFSRYTRVDVWGEFNLQDKTSLSTRFEILKSYGYIDWPHGIREVIAVSLANKRVVLVNSIGKILELPDKKEDQIISVNYNRGVYTVSYISNYRTVNMLKPPRLVANQIIKVTNELSEVKGFREIWQ